MQRELQSQSQYSTPMNRRDWLRMCAQTGITAIAGGLLAHEIGKSSKEKREQEKQHVFRERETIPAFVPIAVRGWRFSIDAEYLKNYFRRFQDRTVTITFRDAIDRGFTPSVVCKNVNLAFSDKNTFSIKETRTPDPYGDIPFLAQGRRDGKEVVELLAFPSDENYSQIKCVEQEERSAFFKEKNYFADALSYPVQHGDENEYEEQRLFYAEKPLYNEATEKLPERLYEKINALIAPFRSLTPMTPRRPFKPVYIYHDPDVYNALYHTEGECVAMTDAYFVNPRYADEGFQALYHECAHAMIARIQSIEELLSPLYEVSSVYKQLSDLGEYYNKHDSPRSPWDIFDESNYAGGKEDTAGHPWSDYNELFASALTVFRFFPDAFIERARVLPNAEQKIASRAVHSIGGLFKKIAESNGSNPEKAIAGLIPEYETLIDAIKKLPR